MPTKNPKLKRLQDLLGVANEGLSRSEFTAAFQSLKDYVQRVQDFLIKKIDDRIAQVKDGKDGLPGKDGKNGKDGAPGRDGAHGEVGIQGERGLMGLSGKDGRDGKDGLIPTDAQLLAIIEPLTPKLEDIVKKVPVPSRIGWGAHPLTVYDGTTVIDKNARIINFGSNLTVSRNASGVITVSATGGAGVTELTATGAIDSSNTTFTFVSKPTYIYLDGVAYRENEGWTWNGGTLTATTTKAPDYAIWGQG